MNKKCNVKSYSFFIIDSTLASDHSLPFRENLLERISKLIITIDNMIRDEKMQHNITRAATEISSFFSGKFGK